MKTSSTGESCIDILKRSQTCVDFEINPSANIDDYDVETQQLPSASTSASSSTSDLDSIEKTWAVLPGAYKVQLLVADNQEETPKPVGAYFFATEEGYNFHDGDCGWANQINNKSRTNPSYSRTVHNWKEYAYTGNPLVWYTMLRLGRPIGSHDGKKWSTGTHLDNTDQASGKNKSFYFANQNQLPDTNRLSKELAKLKAVEPYTDRSKFGKLMSASQGAEKMLQAGLSNMGATHSAPPALQSGLSNLLSSMSQNPEVMNFLQGLLPSNR